MAKPKPGFVHFTCTCGRTHTHEEKHGVGPGGIEDAVNKSPEIVKNAIVRHKKFSQGRGRVLIDPTPSKQDGRPRVKVEWLDGPTHFEAWYYVDELEITEAVRAA